LYTCSGGQTDNNTIADNTFIWHVLKTKMSLAIARMYETLTVEELVHDLEEEGNLILRPLTQAFLLWTLLLLSQMRSHALLTSHHC